MNEPQIDFDRQGRMRKLFVKTDFRSPKRSIKRSQAIRKVGRNNPCPCGSGVKFKYCCLIQAPAKADTAL